MPPGMVPSSGDERVMDSLDDVPRLRRLRRCKSVSRAEDIVTEDEKQRRSQPDKPIHKPRDSIFSLTYGHKNYEGMINWAFLLLTIGGARLLLENLNKYGIRVNPLVWVGAVWYGSGKDGEFPILWMLAYANIPVLFAVLVENIIYKNYINTAFGMVLHIVNILHVLLLPIIVIYGKFDQIGPAMGTLLCSIYTVVSLKLWSYLQVNYWCRASLQTKRYRAGVFGTGTYRAAESTVELTTIAKHSPKRKFGQSNSSAKKDHSGNVLLQYPDNLTIANMYYFWFAPTLCYELNFPRSNRIRKTFLMRRALEVIIGGNLMLALVQQWIIPSLVNSLVPFSNMDFGVATERLLKLAIPNHLVWFTSFYLIFHSFLNTVGEVMQFADRSFYHDWWNSNNIIKFWKTWNLPIHRWCVRHLYKPILNYQGNRLFAATCVFFVSAFLHEYLVSVPLRIFKAYAFMGMMLQIPLMMISTRVENHIGPRAGNVIVWLSLIIGQPLAVLMYYHDFVVEHYGKDLIESFGRL